MISRISRTVSGVGLCRAHRVRPKGRRIETTTGPLSGPMALRTARGMADGAPKNGWPRITNTSDLSVVSITTSTPSHGGDMMEWGLRCEAASVAGHQQTLTTCVGLHDTTSTIEGDTEHSRSVKDVARVFEGLSAWNVPKVGRRLTTLSTRQAIVPSILPAAT